MQIISHLLTGYEGTFLLKGRSLEGWLKMPTTRFMDAPVMFEISTSDEVVRQVEDEGELVDVRMVTQIHTINTTNNSYHLVIRNGEIARYQDQLHAGQERLVNLAENEQFEDYQIGTSMSYIPG